jgi:hypothetical protein
MASWKWISGLYSQDHADTLSHASAHFSYKDAFSFYKDTKCVKKHAILMPEMTNEFMQKPQIQFPSLTFFKSERKKFFYFSGLFQKLNNLLPFLLNKILKNLNYKFLCFPQVTTNFLNCTYIRVVEKTKTTVPVVRYAHKVMIIILTKQLKIMWL